MRRRAFLSSGLAALMSPRGAKAQQGARVWRIGYLAPITVQLDAPIQKAFVDGLRTRGYVADQNFTLTVRLALGRLEVLSKLAHDLVQLRVDIIVSGSSSATAAAMEATKTLPIVFFAVTDPITRGFVTSLAKPGANVTGISNDVGSMVAVKRLELLKEIVPSISRVAVISIDDLPGQAPWGPEFEMAARTLGLRLEFHEAKTAADLDGAFAEILGKRPDALFATPSVLTFQHRRRIADFAAEHRLPLMHAWREAAEAGALITCGTDIRGSAHRAAYFVDRILKGANPGDLPVEQPAKFEFVINLRTAKAIGISIPDSILARANEVIE